MSKPAPVKVTVLMTLYNKGPYVAEAVRSALDNTLHDLEVLVVDDASTDGGPDAVRAIADPRVRLLESASNTGRAAAANRGFDAARGEYVAILDADDVVHPERFAKQVAFLDAHPDIGACGSAIQAFGAVDSVMHWPASDHEMRGRLLFGVPVSYGAAMLRRSILEKHRVRCDTAWRRPGMDYLFLLALARHARFANLPDVLLYYRRGEQNMRHGRDPVADFIHLDREVFRLFGLPISEAQLDVHVHLHEPFVERLTAERVRTLRAWTSELARLNLAHGLFPPDVFGTDLERRWSLLFYHLADHAPAIAWTHLRCSGEWSVKKVSYLLRKMLGGTPAPERQ